MGESKTIDEHDQTTRDILFRGGSLKLFRTALSLYESLLEPYRHQDNTTINQELRDINYLNQYLEKKLARFSQDWSLETVPLGGKSLALIKSTVLLLKEDLEFERQNLIKEGAPPEATEHLDKKISKLDSLLDSEIFQKVIAHHPIVTRSKKESALNQATQQIYDAFLCHSSKDKKVVEAIHDKLKELGLRVWFDEAEILPGDSIPQKITQGLNNAKFVLIFISPNLSSEKQTPYTTWEMTLGKTFELLGTESSVIPILIGEAELPAMLKDKHYVDMRGLTTEKDPNEFGDFKRLIKKIKP